MNTVITPMWSIGKRKIGKIWQKCPMADGKISNDVGWQVWVECKKIWRSSSTPASGDAGPIHTGVGKSFRHPWRQFYYKYQTFLQAFKNVELLRQSWKVSKAALPGCEPLSFRLTILYSTTVPHFLISKFKVLSNKYEKRRHSCLRHKSIVKGGAKTLKIFFYTFLNLFLPTTSTLKRLRIKK